MTDDLRHVPFGARTVSLQFRVEADAVPLSRRLRDTTRQTFPIAPQSCGLTVSWGDHETIEQGAFSNFSYTPACAYEIRDLRAAMARSDQFRLTIKWKQRQPGTGEDVRDAHWRAWSDTAAPVMWTRIGGSPRFWGGITRRERSEALTTYSCASVP